MTDEPLVPFTAHNVRLDDGSLTIPGEMLLAERALPQAVLRTLDFCFPGRTPGELTAVDLACLEGGYTALLAEAGFDTLGIEGRENNIERARYVAAGLPHLQDRIRFERDDVRNLASYGTFDVVFCSGLLYHLDHPVAFLELVESVATKVLLLHTHYATDNIPARFPQLEAEMTTNEGVQGRWFREHPDDSPEDERLERRWASLDNTHAFWIEKRHLLQTLRDVGFSMVWEQYDFLYDVVTDHYREDYDASYFVAVKPGWRR